MILETFDTLQLRLTSNYYAKIKEWVRIPLRVVKHSYGVMVAQTIQS